MKKSYNHSIVSGLILFLIITVIPLAATTYYVDSTNGNDSNNGLSPATAWRSVSKVNSSMSLFDPGDSILFRKNRSFKGQGRLYIKASGTAGNTIVFGAYGDGFKPILDEILCNLYGVGYVAVENFMVTNAESGIAFTNYNHHVRVSSCDIESMNNNGIVITRVDTYVIENCVIKDCVNSGIAIIGSADYKVRNGIIRNNRINNIHRNDGITIHVNDSLDECGPNHQVIGNICSHCAENGLDITSGSNILLRGNETFGNNEAGTLVGGTNVSDVWIDRHYAHEDELGIAFGRNVNVKMTSSIIYNANYHQVVITPATSLTGFEAYHNTFVYGPNSTGLILDINSRVRNVTFKNNLFVSTRYTAPQTYVRFSEGSTPSSVNARFDYNTYWRSDNDSSNRWYVNGNISFSRWQSTWGQDIHGKWINPRLVNLTGKDYHLRKDSPCIDEGASTSVRRDFEGTAIPQGTAPDVGAYEYDSGNPPPVEELEASIFPSVTAGEVPLTVDFVGSASGGTSPYSFAWNFGDGQTSSLQNPSHTYQNTGTNAARLTVTDKDNKSDSASVSIQVYPKSLTPLHVTANAAPTIGTAPLTVNFSSSATGGTPPYFFRWKFGNGDTSRKEDPAYTYKESGNFRASLTVTDTHNNQFVVRMTIKVSDETLLADFSCAPEELFFGAATSGVKTPDQHFHILDTGLGIVNWSIKTDKNWISCSPLSGVGGEKIIVRVKPAELSAGTYTGKISVSAPNAIKPRKDVTVTLQVFDQDNPPIGSIDSPPDDSFVSGNIPLAGWALDDIEVTRVEIKRSADPNDIPENIGPDGMILLGEATFLEDARIDIQDVYPDYPMIHKGGWGFNLPTYQLPNRGTGTYTISAVATDSSGQSALIGTKTITSNNINGVSMIGAIDDPQSAEIVSGTAYPCWGWILAPQPDSIPTDGSTIWVWVNGIPLGHPLYNQYREDIAGLFPECLNAQGAGASYPFDSTEFPNGFHTMVWSAMDAAGNYGAVDATQFFIDNPGGESAQIGYLESKSFYQQDTGGSLDLAIESLKKDYTLDPVEEIVREEDGTVVVDIEEMEPLHIHFDVNQATIEGFFGWGEQEWIALPVGSTLSQDEELFCWIPPPGFLGTYLLHFAFTDGFYLSQPLRVRVNVVPKVYENGKKKQRKIKR